MQTNSFPSLPKHPITSAKIDWQALVTQWQSSGLSQKAFCRINSIVYENFTYHCAKLRKNLSPKLLPIRVSQDNTATPKLSASNLILHLPNGAYVSIPNGVDAATLKTILVCMEI